MGLLDFVFPPFGGGGFAKTDGGVLLSKRARKRLKKERNREKQEQQIISWECQLCFETHSGRGSRLKTTCCKSVVCATCDARWIDESWPNPTCCVCADRLAPSWPRVTRAVLAFPRLERRMIRSAVDERADAGTTVFECPREACGALFLLGRACAGSTVRCAACGHISKAAPPPGHAVIDACDHTSLRRVVEETIPCGGCGLALMRDQGCATLRCPACKTDTCWGCGAVGKHHIDCGDVSDMMSNAQTVEARKRRARLWGDRPALPGQSPGGAIAVDLTAMRGWSDVCRRLGADDDGPENDGDGDAFLAGGGGGPAPAPTPFGKYNLAALVLQSALFLTSLVANAPFPKHGDDAFSGEFAPGPRSLGGEWFDVAAILLVVWPAVPAAATEKGWREWLALLRPAVRRHPQTWATRPFFAGAIDERQRMLRQRTLAFRMLLGRLLAWFVLCLAGIAMTDVSSSRARGGLPFTLFAATASALLCGLCLCSTSPSSGLSPPESLDLGATFGQLRAVVVCSTIHRALVIRRGSSWSVLTLLLFAMVFRPRREEGTAMLWTLGRAILLSVFQSLFVFPDQYSLAQTFAYITALSVCALALRHCTSAEGPSAPSSSSFPFICLPMFAV